MLCTHSLLQVSYLQVALSFISGQAGTVKFYKQTIKRQWRQKVLSMTSSLQSAPVGKLCHLYVDLLWCHPRSEQCPSVRRETFIIVLRPFRRSVIKVTSRAASRARLGGDTSINTTFMEMVGDGGWHSDSQLWVYVEQGQTQGLEQKNDNLSAGSLVY